MHQEHLSAGTYKEFKINDEWELIGWNVKDSGALADLELLLNNNMANNPHGTKMRT